MRLAIVHRDLLALGDRPQRVELHAAIADHQAGVRRAGVVGETHRIGRARRIDRLSFRDFHDHDPRQSYDAPARLGHGDRLAADFADLAPRRDRFGGKCAEAVDAAAGHPHVVLLIGRADRERGHDGYAAGSATNTGACPFQPFLRCSATTLV
jgi:hypothetical protein